MESIKKAHSESTSSPGFCTMLNSSDHVIHDFPIDWSGHNEMIVAFCETWRTDIGIEAIGRLGRSIVL